MQILLAEDDPEVGIWIERNLTELGHVVERVVDGEQVLDAVVSRRFDVIALDRLMPRLEGLEVLRRLRAQSVQTPVLLVTALGSISERVDGLNAGADDYLVKPFAMAELVARLSALARRPPINEVVRRLEVGDIVLDIKSREVRRGGRIVYLQPREFSLLELLMRNVGQTVTRTMFLEEVWGFNFDPTTNIVESHLSRVRSKLREGFADDPIETVRGAGYRLREGG